MKAILYNQNGTKEKDIDVPESVFGLPWNGDLVHQTMTSLYMNMRKPRAHVKDRSKVRGGGKKPWKQKGTGRARHGSIRSPLWRGGGVTFGPSKEKNYERKDNKKATGKALRTVLSKKWKDGEVVFFSALSLPDGKAKGAHAMLSRMSGIPGFSADTRAARSICLYVPEHDRMLERSFKNFGNVRVVPIRDINMLDILNCTHVIIVEPEKSLVFLAGEAAGRGISEVVAPDNAGMKRAPRAKTAKASAHAQSPEKEL